MRLKLKTRLAAVAAILGTGVAAYAVKPPPGPGVDESIKSVLAQTPSSYPAIVTAVPYKDEIGNLSTEQLFEMLTNWNPALRRAAANALSEREAAIPKLRKAAYDKSPTVQAGAVNALASMVNYQLRNASTIYPDIKNPAEAQAKVKAKFADLTDLFIELTRSEVLQVRAAAMNAIIALRPDSKKAAAAMLELVRDPDAHLASTAMIMFEKRFDIDSVERRYLIDTLKKAMQGPFPRSRGHAMRMIKQLNEDEIREFIPLFLAHLDWQPDRDTMFGNGAQAESVQLLTRFNVKELIPRLPKLMNKTMRGPGLFLPVCDSVMAFGKDAKPILPELKAERDRLKGLLPNAHRRHRPGLENKINKLSEVIEHVENL